MVKIVCLVLGLSVLVSLTGAESNFLEKMIHLPFEAGHRVLNFNEKVVNLTIAPIKSFGDKIITKIGTTWKKITTSGIPAIPENYPYLVEVRNGDQSNVIICGGVIINHNYILTSALCFDNVDITQHNIKIVTIAPNKTVFAFGLQKQYQQEIPVERIIRHKCYIKNSQEKLNDIAILELQHSLQYNKNVNQIKLPDRNYEPEISQSGEILGSGLGLLKADVQVMELQQCARYFPITTHQVCVIQGEGSCVGQAAGFPLLQYNERKEVILAGIGSYTSDDCTKTPTVYTRISKYMYWITAILDEIHPAVVC